MAACFDVVHLEDTVCVCSKDLKKQGRLRHYMLSAFLAISQMLHALHSLWLTLFPFALLWWNAMLHATCAKYYSWNRSPLHLHKTGRRFCGNIVCVSCSFSEASTVGVLLSPHERGSIPDSSYVENREISIFSILSQATCATQSTAALIALEHRKLQIRSCDSGVSTRFLPLRNVLHMLNHYDNIAAACPKSSDPQFKDRIACQTTSLVSNAQLVATPSRASKRSSLCFLQGRQPQPSGVLKGGVLSGLLPHPAPRLAMLNVDVGRQISLDHLCLQVHLHGNGSMLDLTVPVLVDHVSANRPMLREWLQMFNGGCVPALNSGKEYLDLARNPSKLWASQTRHDNYAILQLILSTTDSFIIFNAVPSDNTAESLKLRTREQLSLLDSSGFKMMRHIAYADNESRSGSDRIEDIGSVCGASIKSDNGCDGTYCIDDEFTSISDDRFGNSGDVYRKQCYRGDGYGYNWYRGYEDSGIHSAENVEHVYGNLKHPAVDKEDSFYDCSADSDVRYDAVHCVTDVDGFCSANYEASDGEYDNFEGDVEHSGINCGDCQFAYEDGVDDNALEIMPLEVAELDTWWDDDVVLVVKQEREEGSIEQEWQLV